MSVSEFGTLERQAKLKEDDTVSLNLPLRWGQILLVFGTDSRK